jgi:TonB dependent receptor/Carboxypeptidase regulatory-like domain/TonB-dependent Receptor Plug Domain
MSFRRLRVIAGLLCLAAGLIAVPALAQVTGSMQGSVKGSTDNLPLPGVTIEAKGASLQGTKSTVSGSDGSFRLSLLPPGEYVVSFALSGFNKVEKKVAVQLDKVVVVDAGMALSTKQAEIVVTGEAPTIDATSSSSGANFTSDFVKTLPVGRGFQAIATKTPGVIAGFGADSANFSVYGSTGAENSFIIDGVDTTAVRYATQGKQVTGEFIQEIEVKAGAFQAEYGHAQGGVLNAITKSGGNDFHGDVFGYYSGKPSAADGSNIFQAQDKHLQAKSDSFGTVRSTTDPIRNTTNNDFGADLGGFFIKDRIWFFGAYDRVYQGRTDYLNNAAGSCTTTPCPPGTGPGTGSLSGASLPTTFDQDLYAGKLTFTAANWLTFVGSIFGDPQTRAPNLGTPLAGAGVGTYAGTQKTGGVDYSGRISGVVGSSFLFEGQAAKHQEENTPLPANTSDPRILPTIPSGLPRQGGFGFYESAKYNRNYFKANASLFASFLGSHEFKGGGDYVVVRSEISRQYTGPVGHREDIYTRQFVEGTVYQHEYNSTGLRNAAGDPIQADSNIAPISRTNNYALFIQDKWQVLPNLTLNVGFRYEDQKVKDVFGVTQIHVANELMPRVGFAWDFLGGGKSRLYGNFARFYETMPTDINIRAYGYEITTAVYNTDISSDHGDASVCGAGKWHDAAGNAYTVCSAGRQSTIKTGGSFGEPTQPGIKGQFSDEISLGVEFQPLPDLSVDAKFIYRSLGRVIEDMGTVNSNGDLEYFIVNPGTTFISPDTGALLGADYTDVPPRRFYRALQLTAQKRFSNKLQFIASYTLSHLKGNYDGVFQTSTTQLDPNINSAYDYRRFLDHAYGDLSNDRRHTFKVDGSYVTPFNLVVGLSAYYFTGTPLTAMGYDNDYRNYELYLVDRGTVGRTPDVYDADLHLGYQFPVGPVRILVGADVFSVFNTQRTAQQDQRYNIGPGGPQQANYLQPVAWTPRRSLRLTTRISF